MIMKNIFKRGKQVMDKLPGLHSGADLESKYTCSFCGIGCDVAYSGLKPVLFMGGEIPPHHTHACVECYRKQRKEIYPDETPPV